MRTQFTFYESVYLEIRKIKDPVIRATAYDMVCCFALSGCLPKDTENLCGENAAAFFRLLPVLQKERRLSMEGRRCSEYKAWRTAVFQRDNYTRQLCGSHGVKLNAHHRLPYATYPNLRYDVDNGVTLCVPCHNAVHRGAKNGR